MKYLIVMHVDPTVLEHLTDEQQQAIGEGHAAFKAKTKESGEFISMQALGDPSTSKVVRSNGVEPEVTDGPFVEAKEFLGGFYLVDVEDEARAIELAKQIPDARIPAASSSCAAVMLGADHPRIPGLALEVRPVVFADLGND